MPDSLTRKCMRMRISNPLRTMCLPIYHQAKVIFYSRSQFRWGKCDNKRLRFDFKV